MKTRQIPAALLVMTATTGLTGGLTAGAAPAVSASPSASSSTCVPDNHDDAWPSWADGRPLRDPGVRLWHDALGWHVRVTHDTIRDRVFSGVIATKGELVNVHAVRLERGDQLNVAPGKHSLTFRFNNYGGIDGFDFVTHCAPALAFGFLTDDHAVGTTHISIGAGARNPLHNPFVITRTA